MNSNEKKAGDWENLLQETRPRHAQKVPDNLILNSPLCTDTEFPCSHPFDQYIQEEAKKMIQLKGHVLLFDLDDTLLVTNYICGDEWMINEEHIECHHSIDYSKLSHSPGYWFKAGWRRPVREQYDSTRYQFLKNPPVEAQIRPGALAMLHGLRSAGAILVLATLCARRRLEFIFSRLPQLKACFQKSDGFLRIICAEDLAKCAWTFANVGPPECPVDLPDDMQGVWDASVKLHKKDPDRFSLKTLPVIYCETGLTRIDLLVDDSQQSKKDFSACGLKDRFIHAPGNNPNGPVMWELLRTTGNLSSAGRYFPPPGVSPQPSLKNYSYLRFEDPYYFPYVHTSDRFPNVRN